MWQNSAAFQTLELELQELPCKACRIEVRQWEAEGTATAFEGLGQTQWLNSSPNVISSEIISRLDYLNVFLGWW